MKTRDSGMPDHGWWESFFDPDAVLDALGLNHLDGPVVDVGCGYGTFTVAIARRTVHPVIAIDIEPAMVDLTATKIPTCLDCELQQSRQPPTDNLARCAG